MINRQRTQIIGLSIMFAIITIIVALIWLPYLKLVILGAILAILFHPIYKRLLKNDNHKTLAAAGTVVFILFIIFIPLYIVGQGLFNEIIGLYNTVQQGHFSINTSGIIQHLPAGLQDNAAHFLQDVGQKISGFAANAFVGITAIVSNVASFVLSFFLVMFTVFYLLRDGENIKTYVSGILPLSPMHETHFIEKLEAAINGVIKGSFLVALIQGVVATVGFFIFGVPNALLWGAFTVLAALVPTVGTSLSIIPAVLYLFLTGHAGSAVGMLIWGMVAVGTIDNIISPKLVGSTTDLHPLLVLFSILGGLQFFGFIGFLLGPIMMAVFVVLLDIFRKDLTTYLES